MEKLIGEILKNKGERIRVAVSKYEEHDLIDLRTYYRLETSGEWRPTRKGIAIRPDLLPELITLLQEAEREARAAGLIADKEKAAA